MVAKVAVTEVAPSSVTVQAPLPVHPPPVQPVKAVFWLVGVAVSVTAVPAAKLAEHVLAQLIPAGALVTMPCFPEIFTVRATGCAGPKVAVMLTAEASVTAQGPVPVHPPPLQPVKLDPEPALAVRVTVVPLA